MHQQNPVEDAVMQAKESSLRYGFMHLRNWIRKQQESVFCLDELYFQWRVSSIKLYVQTLLVYVFPEGNRAVAGKQNGKNTQSKMTEFRFLSVYAEGI